MESMWLLVGAFGWPPSEIKAIPLRELTMWVRMALAKGGGT